jgi:hypothetical protein
MPLALPPDLPVVSAELEDLARAHVSRWLANALPAEGACLVVDRDPALAQALAAAGRVVALAVPTAALAELAANRCGAEVLVTQGLPADPGPLACLVVASGSAVDLDALLTALDPVLPAWATVVVVALPDRAADIREVLEARGRSTRSHPQVVRAASCIGTGEAGLLAADLGGEQLQPVRVLVISGEVQGRPDALLGADSGPRAWRDASAGLVSSLQEAHRRHQELLPAAQERDEARDLLKDAEQELAVLPDLQRRLAAAEGRADRTTAELQVAQQDADKHRARVEELLGSTSWRAGAPLRFMSDLLHRR